MRLNTRIITIEDNEIANEDVWDIFDNKCNEAISSDEKHIALYLRSEMGSGVPLLDWLEIWQEKFHKEGKSLHIISDNDQQIESMEFSSPNQDLKYFPSVNEFKNYIRLIEPDFEENGDKNLVNGEEEELKNGENNEFEIVQNQRAEKIENNENGILEVEKVKKKEELKDNESNIVNLTKTEELNKNETNTLEVGKKEELRDNEPNTLEVEKKEELKDNETNTLETEKEKKSGDIYKEALEKNDYSYLEDTDNLPVTLLSVGNIVTIAGEYKCRSCNGTRMWMKGKKVTICQNPECFEPLKGWELNFDLF